MYDATNNQLKANIRYNGSWVGSTTKTVIQF